MAKTKLRYGWSKVLYKLGLIPHRLYRTQHGMTRDPYTYTIAAIRINRKQDEYEPLKPPRSIYSPTFWAWQKYIYKGGPKWLNRYVYRESGGTPARQYVKDLCLARAKAAGCWELYHTIEKMEVRPDKG